MKHFKEWLSSKDGKLYETLYGQELTQPKKVNHDPDEEKGKRTGWQPDVQGFSCQDTGKLKDEMPKNTIWVKNADQWSEKDRTAK